MANQLEGPKFPKPIRAAAIIETAQGVLLVQDMKDLFRQNTLQELSDELEIYLEKGNVEYANRKVAAMRIVDKGRFSLPGGGIEPIDYHNAGAESLFGLPRPPSTPEELAHFRNVVREAALREVSEEIGAEVDCEQVPTIIEIQGRLRHHVIVVLRAEGEIYIKGLEEGEKKEISGIGFLNEDNIIALNRTFYQSHVQKIMDRYIKDKKNRREIIPRYLSNLRVPKKYMDQWHANQKSGYANRPRRYRHKYPEPPYPNSSPTFVIIGAQNGVHNPYEPRSLTDNIKARIVPQHPDPNKPASSPPPKSTPPKPILDEETSASVEAMSTVEGNDQED